jgi:hypothetical protein
MRRRQRDNARVNAFAKKIALHEIGRGDIDIHDEENPGLYMPPIWIEEFYLPWRQWRILPSAGGWGDQDGKETDALLDMDRRVAWYKQRLQAPDMVPPLEDS